VTAAETEPASGGKAAERVSNSCFAALMLTNSFSQMINVSDRLSLLAGLTARIHQLAEVRVAKAQKATLHMQLPARLGNQMQHGFCCLCRHWTCCSLQQQFGTTRQRLQSNCCGHPTQARDTMSGICMSRSRRAALCHKALVTLPTHRLENCSRGHDPGAAAHGGGPRRPSGGVHPQAGARRVSRAGGCAARRAAQPGHPRGAHLPVRSRRPAEGGRS
jgi:hypothetical protein